MVFCPCSPNIVSPRAPIPVVPIPIAPIKLGLNTGAYEPELGGCIVPVAPIIPPTFFRKCSLQLLRSSMQGPTPANNRGGLRQGDLRPPIFVAGCGTGTFGSELGG